MLMECTERGNIQYCTKESGMAFPITVTGVVKLPFGTERISVTEYMSAVEKCLENEKAKKIVVSGNKITFRGGMFRFVSKSNLLVTIDHGQVQVEELPTELHVTYRLSFLQIFVLTSVFVMFLVFILHDTIVSSRNASYLILIWLWVFGGNFAVGLFRFRRFLLKVQPIDVRRAPSKEPKTNDNADIPDMDEERASL